VDGKLLVRGPRPLTRVVPYHAAMPIGPGSRVGPYTVTGLLGEGGMGKVWRARHLALKRDDALKVLPEAFARDPQRLARFQREAEILASLNHAHVAQVHGLEEADGASVLVMELVDGPTLADRLDRGALPLDEALPIARQIADALEAAHEQGIVHRDLKPANVKLRRDGTVKVLDFGLAKALVAGESEAETTQSPTLDLARTATGAILGTPSYMSPEQARGAVVDARADVWAFGCVLYEMLAGRRPFRGGSAPETLAAVLGSDPDWSSLPATVPPHVHVLLRRCLARDLGQRVKHMSTVRLLLDEQHALSTRADRGPDRERSPRAWVTAAAVVAAASAAFAAATWLQRPVAPQIVRTAVLADTAVQGSDRSFAFLPDGRLAYVSRDTQQILVRAMDALEPVPILKTASYLRGVFPSPDGRWLAFVENAFTLKKVPAAGGPAVPILQMDGPSRGAAWGPDDTIVFATGNAATGLQQVSAGGGPATVLTRPDAARGEADHLQPVWLPQGRGVLFTVAARSGRLDSSRIAVLERGASTWRTLIEGGFAAQYVETGHLVYAAAGALWAVRFDLARLTVEGAAVEVLPNVPFSGFGLSAHFDVASTGALTYPRDAESDSDDPVPVWVDREGRETPLPAPPGPYRHPRLSPDGRRLAIVRGGDIFVWDVDRPWATASRMTFAPAIDWFPVWTPDGRRIVFGSWRGGGFSNLYIQDPDGGEAERLTDSDDMQLPTGITPDGSAIVFHSFTRRLEALRLDAPAGGERQVALVETPLEERNGDVSPDGRWLAYEAESPTWPGMLDVYVRPFPDTGRGMWQVTNGGGTYPRWAASGRELFYMKPDGTVAAVPVQATGTTWRTGSPVDLFRGPYLNLGDGSLGRHYDVSPDGRRFLMLKASVEKRAAHFVLVQNWTAELNRLTSGR
jgi:hypothetical protein